MSTELKYELFERELLNPLRGYKLTEQEEFVANLLLDATAATPIGIKRIIRAVGADLCVRPGRTRRCAPTEREVKDIVRTLRKEHGLPILSRRRKPSGYWWCGSEQEMKDYYERARSQPLDELHTLSKMVKQNYPALAGQLSLEDAEEQVTGDG